MNAFLLRLLTVVFLMVSYGTQAQDKANTSNKETAAPAATQAQDPMYRPLVERYILDELKQVRMDQQHLRTELVEKLAHVQVDATDRAVTYTTETVNNVFFIITAAASILVLVGLTSLRDVKTKVEEIVDRKINTITQEYEKRLATVESNLKKRSAQLIAAQEEIAKTNEIHSLWMRSGLESHLPTKIKIYDEILKLHPNEVEAIAYKADAVLDLGESEWALNLSNQAIEIDQQYGNAYWQRACANASLSNNEAAVLDIKKAIECSPHLQNEISNERAFAGLAEDPDFIELLPKEEQGATS